jgi:hypothetical protein
VNNIPEKHATSIFRVEEMLAFTNRAARRHIQENHDLHVLKGGGGFHDQQTAGHSEEIRSVK